MTKLEELLDTDYVQEHSDAAKIAENNFESWLDLIIWDLLEIQETPDRLIEATRHQKFSHCIDTLKEDIAILERQTGENPKIFYLQESNHKMISLMGYISETFSILDEKEVAQLKVVIEDLKLAIHNYIERTGSSLIGVKEATKRWNKLSPEKKYSILHDIDARAEKDYGEDGVALKD